MKKEVFVTAWAALIAAFPANKISEETRDVYWKALREIPDDLWSAGVQQALKQCQFFPTIHELGAACCGEQKAERKWVEDAWRERGGFMQEIEAVTWQENLTAIRRQRGLIPADEKPMLLGEETKPKRRSERRRTLLRAKQEKIAKLERQLDEYKTEIVQLRAALREKSRLERMEEQRERLLAQAKQLGAVS